MLGLSLDQLSSNHEKNDYSDLSLIGSIHLQEKQKEEEETYKPGHMVHSQQPICAYLVTVLLTLMLNTELYHHFYKIYFN